MKKFIFGAMLFATVASFAQEKQEKQGKPEGGRPGKEQRLSPDEQTKQLTKDLNLDAAQQERVKAFYAEQEKKHAANKPEGGKKPDGKKPEKGERPEPPKGEDPRKQEREEADAKMKEILTKDQYKKWQKTNKSEAPAGKKGGKKSE